MRWFGFFFLLLFPVWGADSAQPRMLAPEVQLRGLDVSHHQKEIEWDTVARHETLDFAFVKATEGGDFVDSLFCDNWESLRRLGIKRGAYHFFRPLGCGDTQAFHFLKTVEMHPGDLAPVLDVEVLDGVSPDLLRQEMHVWLDTVERHLGVRPIIYTNQHFFERFLAEEFAEYPLWIARYSDERPALSKGLNWNFWQRTNEGCVEGISKKVDLNVFYGTPEMLDQLCWNPAPTTALP